MKNPLAKAEKYLNKVVQQLKAKEYKGNIDICFILAHGYSQNIPTNTMSKALLKTYELKQKEEINV